LRRTEKGLKRENCGARGNERNALAKMRKKET